MNRQLQDNSATTKREMDSLVAATTATLGDFKSGLSLKAERKDFDNLSAQLSSVAAQLKSQISDLSTVVMEEDQRTRREDDMKIQVL
jgi:hypothetical protein